MNNRWRKLNIASFIEAINFFFKNILKSAFCNRKKKEIFVIKILDVVKFKTKKSNLLRKSAYKTFNVFWLRINLQIRIYKKQGEIHSSADDSYMRTHDHHDIDKASRNQFQLVPVVSIDAGDIYRRCSEFAYQALGETGCFSPAILNLKGVFVLLIKHNYISKEPSSLYFPFYTFIRLWGNQVSIPAFLLMFPG